MNKITYAQAAFNIAGVPVSIEPDGSCWTGLDADRIYLDDSEVQAEFERIKAEAVKIESNRLSALKDARSLALSLGFTEAMLAVMYPQLEGA